MQIYIGTKVVKAEPQPCQKDIHNSKVGDPGYKVEYEDGYVSWSPAEIFEKAYSINGKLTFGQAFDIIRSGGAEGMRLSNWQDDVVIKVQFPDENSKMTAPYLYVESRFGKVPWKETMIELFSKEWKVI